MENEGTLESKSIEQTKCIEGKLFNLIFLSPTVINLGFFLVKNFQPYFSKSYSESPTVRST